MTRRFSLFLVALMTLLFSSVSFADSPKGVEGNWIFYITIDGAPPCQCISLTTFNEDGSLEAPANDRFSGDVRGQWRGNSHDGFNLTFAFNTMNPDGSAAGIFVVKSLLKLTSTNTGNGTFTYEVVINGGTTVATGKGTYKAVRMVP